MKSIHKDENIEKANKDMLIYFFAGDKNPIDNFGRRIINLNDKLKKYRVKEVSYKLYKDGRN